MFGVVADAAGKVMREVFAEIAADPGRLIAEVVQFLLLVGIGWLVAMGFGRHRGFLANIFAERGERLRERLDGVSRAGHDLDVAKREARRRMRDANAEARRVLAEAKVEAARIEDEARAEADAEAGRINDRAEAALATERENLEIRSRDELVGVVSQAVRSLLNEHMPVADQRRAIQEALVAGVASASASASPERAGDTAAPVSSRTGKGRVAP